MNRVIKWVDSRLPVSPSLSSMDFFKRLSNLVKHYFPLILLKFYRLFHSHLLKFQSISFPLVIKLNNVKLVTRVTVTQDEGWVSKSISFSTLLSKYINSLSEMMSACGKCICFPNKLLFPSLRRGNVPRKYMHQAQPEICNKDRRQLRAILSLGKSGLFKQTNCS